MAHFECGEAELNQKAKIYLIDDSSQQKFLKEMAFPFIQDDDYLDSIEKKWRMLIQENHQL